MEVFLAVERVKLAVVHGGPIASPCKVVDHNVKHEIHAATVKCSCESLQIILGAECGIDSVEILLPISMVCCEICCDLGLLVCDWRYPDL